jgi:hypothetical protein
MTALALANRSLRTCYKVKPTLAALGLKYPCRWPEARARIKTLMIQARRSENAELAIELSQVKQFLRNNLPTVCSCGSLISPGSIKCKICEHCVSLASKVQVGTTVI